MGAGRTVPLVRAYCKSRLREGPNLIHVTGTKWPTDLHAEPTHTFRHSRHLGFLCFGVKDQIVSASCFLCIRCRLNARAWFVNVRKIEALQHQVPDFLNGIGSQHHHPSGVSVQPEWNKTRCSCKNLFIEGLRYFFGGLSSTRVFFKNSEPSCFHNRRQEDILLATRVAVGPQH